MNKQIADALDKIKRYAFDMNRGDVFEITKGAYVKIDDVLFALSEPVEAEKPFGAIQPDRPWPRPPAQPQAEADARAEDAIAELQTYTHGPIGCRFNGMYLDKNGKWVLLEDVAAAVLRLSRLSPTKLGAAERQCPECKGKGVIVTGFLGFAPCPTCKATGRVSISTPPIEASETSLPPEVIAYYEQVAREEYPKADKPDNWPSWQAKAEEMERNWIGATETHTQLRAEYDKQNDKLSALRAEVEELKEIQKGIAGLPRYAIRPTYSSNALPEMRADPVCGQWIMAEQIRSALAQSGSKEQK